MRQAQIGDKVKAHYTGRLADGTIFDSSEGNEPLNFTIGDGSLIKGFEQGVIGMQEGESREVTIQASDGYGMVLEELIAEIPKNRLPEDLSPEIGMQLQITQTDGTAFPVSVVEVKEDTIKVDANHPLAGKTLIFDIQLVEIE